VGESIQACVIQAVKRIEFPAPPDGEPIKVNYPFSFVH
jgi:hypothetical protein